MQIRRITITAHWVDNPLQGWAGWLARVTERGQQPHYQGEPRGSFCDAIDSAAKSWRASDPCISITTRDPSDAQKRKAWNGRMEPKRSDSRVREVSP